MKGGHLVILIIFVIFVDVSVQAWQKYRGLDCSGKTGGNPLGRNKKKTLLQCKKACQKKKKCDGILRKTKDGKRKGICQLRKNLKIQNCDEDIKYTFYQFRGYNPSTTIHPETTSIISTTEQSTNTDYKCKYGIQTYPTSLPNSHFYTRLCTTSKDLKVISGSRASDAALEKTAFLIGNVMANVDPRVAQEMDNNGFRHAVMAAYPSELTTSIPEHSWLGSWWDERARGLGATLSTPVGSSAEENALCYPDDRYLGEDITIHEFAHSMHLTGLTEVFPTFDTELTALYNAANFGNFWGSGHYAMTDYKEYFAEGVQSYFDANYSDPGAPATRDQLQTQDPNFYTFLDKYLGNNQWKKQPC